MKPPRPTLPVPPGFTRLFMGDGKTRFKGPAMFKANTNDPWHTARGGVSVARPVFVNGYIYALPALTAVRKARHKSLGLIACEAHVRWQNWDKVARAVERAVKRRMKGGEG